MPYYRRNLLLLSVTVFLAAVSWNQVQPFLPEFVRELGVNRKDIYFWSGWVFSLPAIASMIFQPMWGKLADKYGRKPMIIRAGLCLSSIYFLMSICRTPVQLVILRFLNGALTGFIPGSIALVATNTPTEEAPRSVAIMESAIALGPIMGPSLGFMLAELCGYRMSMRFSGTAVFICTLLVLLLVQEPNKVRSEEKTSLIQDFVVAMRSPIMLSIMFTALVLNCFGPSIMTILVLHLPRLGHLPSLIKGIIFALPATAIVLCSYQWTRFGEHRGFGTIIRMGMIGAAIATFVLGFITNRWIFMTMYFAAGVFMAALSPAMGSLICTRIREGFRGRAYAILSSAGMVGAFLAPLASSRIADHMGTPRVFTMVGIILFSGSLIFPLIARRWTTEATTDALSVDFSEKYTPQLTPAEE